MSDMIVRSLVVLFEIITSMNPHVRLLDGWSVSHIFLKAGKLPFHASTAGALVIFGEPKNLAAFSDGALSSINVRPF